LYKRKLIRLGERGATAEEIIEIKILLRGTRNKIHTLSTPRSIYEPPNLSELFILLIFPHKSAEDALGDLKEEYKDKFKEEGPKAAKKWLARQVRDSAWVRAKPLILKIIVWIVLTWVANHII